MTQPSPIRTRFAPSPTGFLHLGGARTALYNWLFARRYGGTYVVRVEDTDAARNTSEGLEIILDSLRWLGLDWDEGPGVGGEFGPYHQSQRTEIYDRYLEQLNSAGSVYEEDGAIRFRVPDREITVADLVCGDVSVNLVERGSKRWDPELKQEVEANPDFVIRRPDGSYIFHFVNVVDDIEMKISHVIRGEDHLSNTPKHLALFEALGATAPEYAHIPLNLNRDGSKMSKRDKGALIHEYLENGFIPDAVNNYMVLLGWSSKDDQEIFTMAELREKFDLPGVNHANSKFDYEKCLWVNSEHLKRLSPGDLLAHSKPFLEKAEIPANDPRIPAALELTRERAQLLSEIPALIASIFREALDHDPAAVEKVSSREGIGEVLAALEKALEDVAEWNEDAIKQSILTAANSLGQKMGAFMLPCRVAAMGSTSGPDLVPTLVLTGRDMVLARIRRLQSIVNAT